MSRVKVDIVADSSKFKEGMEGVKSSVEGIKHLIEATFVADALKEVIGETFEYADAIVNTSEKLRLNTDEVQALSIAARDAGSSLETISKGFEKIELAKAKALLGDKEAISNLQKAGVTNLKNSTLQDFGTISSNAAKGTDQTRVGLAGLGLKEVAGDLALLGDKAKITKERIEELKNAGEIISESDLANIKEAKVEMEAVTQVLITTLAPYIAKFAPTILLGVKDLIDSFALLFIAIAKMASETIDYVENLKKNTKENVEILGESALSGYASSGGGPQGIAGAVYGMLNAQTVGNDKPLGDKLKDTWNDAIEKMIEKDESNSKDMDSLFADILKKLNESAKDVTEPTKNKDLKHDIYSDELTRGGNFLGANLGHAAQAASQLDISKQNLRENKITNELLRKQLAEQERQAANKIIKANNYISSHPGGSDWY